MHLLSLKGNEVLFEMLSRLNYFFILDYKPLYLRSDSIHHSYLNKTGSVTITKFNMNMVRKALNLMLSR